MPTTADLIYHAFEQKPTDFSDAFSEIIGQKAVDRVDALKIEVAQSIYPSDDEDEISGEEPEVEAEKEEIADDITDMSDEELDTALADLLDSEEWTND